MTVVDGSACVLGLGRVGTAMARRLLAHGARVTVWNRSPGPAEALAARGAVVAPTPGGAACAAEVVFVPVTDWAATKAVLLGPEGALTGGPLPGVLVTMTTAGPEDLAALAERTPALLDLGMLGDHRHVASGRARLYLGGRAEAVTRVRPWLDLLGHPVRRVGDLGTATRLRLILNLLLGVQVQMLAEAVALATGVGLDPRLVLDVVTRSGLAQPATGLAAPRLSTGDYSAADFRLRLIARELNLAVATARQSGVELPLAEAAQRTHDTALVLGLGDEDCTAIARVVTAAPPRATVRAPTPTAAGVAVTVPGVVAGPNPVAPGALAGSDGPATGLLTPGGGGR